MKKKISISLYPLILMGILFILTNSCNKDTNNNTPSTAQVPVLTTSSISDIASSSATCGGNITSEGGSTVTACGVCWSIGTMPTVSDSKTNDWTGLGNFTSSITGLTLGNAYYVRAYATNNIGTAYGNEISFTTVRGVGDSYQGGIIAYILQTGDLGYIAGQTHGLIAAPSDQSTGMQWYNGSYIQTGTTGTAVGTGLANTNTIIARQGTGSYAAMLCHNLSLGGYSDWYLPSQDELNKLYLNQAAIGSFTSYYYWSSTEYNNGVAWYQLFFSGHQDINDKATTYYVRAIRSF